MKRTILPQLGLLSLGILILFSSCTKKKEEPKQKKDLPVHIDQLSKEEERYTTANDIMMDSPAPDPITGEFPDLKEDEFHQYQSYFITGLAEVTSVRIEKPKGANTVENPREEGGYYWVDKSILDPQYPKYMISLMADGKRLTDKDEVFQNAMKHYGIRKMKQKQLIFRGQEDAILGPINGIKITAITDYDELHPKGSLLNNIALISYASYTPWIMKRYQKKNVKGYLGDLKEEATEGAQFFKRKALNSPINIDLIKVMFAFKHYSKNNLYNQFENICLGDIEFFAPPTNKNAVIQIEVSFPSGKKLISQKYTLVE